MATPLNVVVDNLTELVRLFGDVALGPGLAGPLFLAGALLVGISLGVFGWLTLGGLVSPLRGN